MARELLAAEFAHALLGDRKTIRIERRQQVDLRIVQQIRDPRVPPVIVGQVLGHVENELSAEGLVTVHVPSKLEHRPPLFTVPDIARHLDEDEISPLHRLPYFVNTRQVGIL